MLKVVVGIKQCSRCKEFKSSHIFYKAKTSKDGLRSECKICTEVAIRKWRKNHPLEAKERYRKGNRNRRLKVLRIISGMKVPRCLNCGCNDIRFLEVNHLNGGGKKEMGSGGTQSTFIGNIINGTRKIDDLSVLCRVCNALDHLKRRFGEVPFKIEWEGNL